MTDPRNSFEPEVSGMIQPGGNLVTAAQISLAISMKRIADFLYSVKEEHDREKEERRK